MKMICCEEQGGVFVIYCRNSLLHMDDKMIQNGMEKAVVWNISVFCVVTALMAFFCSRTKQLYISVQFLKVGIMHSKCFESFPM